MTNDPVNYFGIDHPNAWVKHPCRLPKSRNGMLVPLLLVAIAVTATPVFAKFARSQVMQVPLARLLRNMESLDVPKVGHLTQECGKYLYDLLDPKTEGKELKDVRAKIAHVNSNYRMVTPLVVLLGNATHLQSLVDSSPFALILTDKVFDAVVRG